MSCIFMIRFLTCHLMGKPCKNPKEHLFLNILWKFQILPKPMSAEETPRDTFWNWEVKGKVEADWSPFQQLFDPCWQPSHWDTIILFRFISKATGAGLFFFFSCLFLWRGEFFFSYFPFLLNTCWTRKVAVGYTSLGEYVFISSFTAMPAQ